MGTFRCEGSRTPIRCKEDVETDGVFCERCLMSLDNIQRYRALREEGHSVYAAGLMSGLSDPEE